MPTDTCGTQSGNTAPPVLLDPETGKHYVRCGKKVHDVSSEVTRADETVRYGSQDSLCDRPGTAHHSCSRWLPSGWDGRGVHVGDVPPQRRSTIPDPTPTPASALERSHRVHVDPGDQKIAITTKESDKSDTNPSGTRGYAYANFGDGTVRFCVDDDGIGLTEC